MNKDPKEPDKDPWGFASYDVDKDDDEEQTIIYTRHERSGRVNQYVDNNDGGHGHFSWANEDDYEDDDDDNDTKDYAREESNDHENPSESEVEERSGCYLTSACMAHYQDDFDDNCYELSVLRWFRDNCVSKQDISHYYDVAPQIVKGIENEKFSNIIFEKIYSGVVVPCVKNIEMREFAQAYIRYKRTILAFEKKYCSKQVNNNMVVSENSEV